MGILRALRDFSVVGRGSKFGPRIGESYRGRLGVVAVLGIPSSTAPQILSICCTPARNPASARRAHSSLDLLAVALARRGVVRARNANTGRAYDSLSICVLWRLVRRVAKIGIWENVTRTSGISVNA